MRGGVRIIASGPRLFSRHLMQIKCSAAICPTMRPMRLTRTKRGTLAFITAILLLWCQSLYAIQACAELVVSSTAAAAAAPCHHEPSDAGHGDHGRTNAGECDIAKAFAQEVKLPVLAIADLAATPVPVRVFADRRGTTPCGPPNALGHSPPLNLLHCRLLN